MQTFKIYLANGEPHNWTFINNYTKLYKDACLYYGKENVKRITQLVGKNLVGKNIEQEELQIFP